MNLRGASTPSSQMLSNCGTDKLNTLSTHVADQSDTACTMAEMLTISSPSEKVTIIPLLGLGGPDALQLVQCAFESPIQFNTWVFKSLG